MWYNNLDMVEMIMRMGEIVCLIIVDYKQLKLC